MATQDATHAWGPLQSLQALLTAEAAVQDGDRDRRQSDLALVRALTSEELARALAQASLAQLDLALAHDALAVESRPFSCLSILAIKSAKLEQWSARHTAAVGDADVRTQAVLLLTQLTHFVYQVPVYVAAKELRRVSQLCTRLVALAVELRQSIKAVFPLRSFLERFHRHGHGTVTPLHALFFSVCLEAKCYAAAMPILTRPLLDLQSSLVTTVDVLGYAFYGGCLFLGHKKFQDAIDLFLVAITAPAQQLSAFAVESFKRATLASLLVHGQPLTLPKYTSFVVSRQLEMHVVPYAELARAFSQDKSLREVERVVATHRAVFARDATLGLVGQVRAALARRKLQQLPCTYVTIALGDVATAAGLDSDEGSAAAIVDPTQTLAQPQGGDQDQIHAQVQAQTQDPAQDVAMTAPISNVAVERLLLELVARGELGAMIDKHKGMVKFVLDGEEDEDGGGHGSGEQELEQMAVMTRLQREMETLLAISAQLRAVDTEVVTSAKFQNRVQKDKDRRQRNGGGGGSGGGHGSGDDHMAMGGGFDPMD